MTELNASKTWITNAGMEFLSISEQSELLCQKMMYVNVMETRVTHSGLAYFLYHHPMIVKLDHEDSFLVFKNGGDIFGISNNEKAQKRHCRQK